MPMKNEKIEMKKLVSNLVFFTITVTTLNAQFFLSQKERDSIYKQGQINQENMMNQLGVKAMRPGPSGNESHPNHANYEESLANPCPEIPELLLTKKGKKVTAAKDWWGKRRPEIAEDLER